MDKLQALTIKLRQDGNLTYRQLGEKLGVSHGMAYKIVTKGYDSPIARHYFGLPPKEVSVKPCMVCGGVHTLKTCNKKSRKQYRRAASFSKQNAKLWDEMMEDTETSLTEICNKLLSEWILRVGIPIPFAD